jgi:hypothetical protein
MNLARRRSKLRATGAHLHRDNAKSQRSKTSVQKIDEMGFVLVPHPPYSPDIAPSDFFLFGSLKDYLEGTSFPDEESLISAVRQILSGIPIDMLCRVFDNWFRRLNECVACAGEYLSQGKKEFRKYSIFAKIVLTARTSGPPYQPSISF